MTIEKVEHRQGMSVFTIHEPRRYGELDVQYEVKVSHDPAELAQLPKITKTMAELLNDAHSVGTEGVDFKRLPTGQIIVFKLVYDDDYSSATYRHGAHQVVGPYLLVEEVK